jgi:hypothetical protein
MVDGKLRKKAYPPKGKAAIQSSLCGVEGFLYTQ